MSDQTKGRMDDVIKEKLAQLALGIQGLMKEKAALKEEIRYYQAENRELKSALDQAKSRPKNFGNQGEFDNIAAQNGSYTRKVAAITKKIDVCVEEIDRCIAQLGE